MSTDTLAGRIKEAMKGRSTRSFAIAAGVHDSTLRSILKGAKPTMDNLVAIAREGGVTLDWLATGEGPMERPEPPTGHEAAATAAEAARLTLGTSVDEELFGRLIDGIRATYRQEGVGLPDIELGRLAARMHNDLAADYDDPDERRIAVRAALSQLRRSLRDSPAGADSKRRA